MSRRVVISLAILGIMLGVMTTFAADMLFNNGRLIAHYIHDRNPSCGNGCHQGAAFTHPHVSTFSYH